MKRTLLLLNLTLGAVLCFLNSQAYAEFSLSVTPTVTRNNINFGQLQAGDVSTQEVEIKVTSDTGIRYRITHALLEPLSNEREDMFSLDQIKFFLRNASKGTMLIETPIPVPMGTMEIYTSDNSGIQDTMTLAYTLFIPEVVRPGLYGGRITFNLEPLTAASNAPLQSVTVDISFEMRSEFGLIFSSERGEGRVDFGRVGSGEEEKSAEILIETLGNLGEEYRIYQSLTEPLVNVETQEVIGDGKLTATFSGEASGTLSTNAAVSTESVLVYRSDSAGNPDRFLGNYHLSGMGALSAGRYQGEFLFTIETAAALPAAVATSYPIPVTLEVEPLFDFVVIPEGGTILQFKDLNPGDVVEKELVIQVRSNAAQRYQLQQTIAEPFGTDTGELIPDGNFEALLQEGNKGTLAFENFQPVKMGTILLYTSNHKGDGDIVRLRYRLTVPKEARGGTYQTQLSFSLSPL